MKRATWCTSTPPAWCTASSASSGDKCSAVSPFCFQNAKGSRGARASQRESHAARRRHAPAARGGGRRPGAARGPCGAQTSGRTLLRQPCAPWRGAAARIGAVQAARHAPRARGLLLRGVRQQLVKREAANACAAQGEKTSGRGREQRAARPARATWRASGSRARAECVAEENEGEARRGCHKLSGGGSGLGVGRRERGLGVERHVTDVVEHVVARGAGRHLTQRRSHGAARHGGRAVLGAAAATVPWRAACAPAPRDGACNRPGSAAGDGQHLRSVHRTGRARPSLPGHVSKRP